VDDALHALTRADFDVLLSDIAMPTRSGYDLIRTVRASGAEPFATIPAAAVTASASDEDRKRALAAGFQVHVAKPVDPAMLASQVAVLAGQRRSRVAARSYSPI
jgi:CheY-like chemotaxis protein